MWAVDVDTPEQHAAMVEKLQLPFPMLSDPDRSLIIDPLGLADPDDPRGIARPALVAFDRSGEETYRWVARDYADRLPETELVVALEKVGLDPTSQALPEMGQPKPGPGAVRLEALIPYFRGARYAALALANRHGSENRELRRDAKHYVAETDRFVEALKEIMSSR